MKNRITSLGLVLSLVVALSFCSIVSADSVNWRQEEGTALNVLFVAHPFVDAVRPLIPEFEAKTGIKINLEVQSEVPAFEKILMDLQSRRGTIDVFMTSPLQVWQYATGGWVEALDGYLADPQLTDLQAYDLDDFSPGVLAAGRWNLQPLGGVGEGNTWALPINYETYITAYRYDLFQKFGLKAPTTYDELAEVAKQLTFVAEDGKQIYGVTTRFDKYWDLPFLTYGTMVFSFDGEFIDDEGRVAIDSPEVVAATELFISILQESAPASIGSNTWYDAMQQFASGQYAIAMNEADLFAPVYEDPSQSMVAGLVGYAVPPAGPNGTIKANSWIWQVAMNSASKNKNAAWLFMQWLTSKEVMAETHLNGNMNPVRSSAWEDPRLVEMVESWGEYPGQYAEVQVTMLENYSGLWFPPHPELTRALDRWAEAVQQSFFEGGNVERNLQKAAQDIATMLGLD
ncbi:MAG: sugar ABC transporter substrate-binding protein [Firmicutes bacterium]|nr:sugar ABC transporter substrate-binding protein [Bacillota bacterium]